MKSKIMKYGMLLIAAVLLVAIAFAGAASAVAANEQDGGNNVLTARLVTTPEPMDEIGTANAADEFSDDESNDKVYPKNWDELVAKVSEWDKTDQMRTIILKNESEGAYKNTTGTKGAYSGIPVTGNISIKPTSNASEIKIDANQKGRLFNVTGSGSLTLAGNGAATLTLTNGTAPKDYPGSSYSCGGAVQVLSGSFTLGKGVTISDSTADCGAGVYVEKPGTFTMKNGSITGCSGKYDGGVYVWNDGIFTMSGGEISDCASTEYAGKYCGVIIDGGVFNVKGSAMIPGTGNGNVSLNGDYTLKLAGTLTGKVKIAYPEAGKGATFGTANKAYTSAKNITSADGNYYGFIKDVNPYKLEWKKVPQETVYVVENAQKIDEAETLEDAVADVAENGIIYLNKPTVDISTALTIKKGVTIKANTSAVIRLTQDIPLPENGEYPLLTLSVTSAKAPITLENVTFDFNDHYGNIVISDYNKTAGTHTQPVYLTNVTLKGMRTDLSPEYGYRIYTALHINGADVTMTKVNIELPDDSLIGRWICMMDLEYKDGRSKSNLTIDSMPYGAYCLAQSGKEAEVWQKTGASVGKVDPISIELPLGEFLNVWPGFEAEDPVYSWDGLNTTAAAASFGDVIRLMNDITSDTDPEFIDIPAGVIINATNKNLDPYTINLTSGHYIVVHDLLTLATLLGYSAQVTYGDGYIVTGNDIAIDDLAKLPEDTKIWLERSLDPVEKNNVTVELPDEAIIPVDEYGLVSLRVNKNMTITGDGTIKFTDDLRGNKSSLWVNGTLNLMVPVTQWPSLGINGTGTVNILNPESKMPAKIPDEMKDKIEVAPITVSGTGKGTITDSEGKTVDAATVMVKYNSSWTISSDKLNLTITDKDGEKSYILKPKSGYTAKWVEQKTTTTFANANGYHDTVSVGQFKAVFTANPSSSSSGGNGGATVILTETPTTAPTVKPTVNPTIAPSTKPTAQQTQKSPAPVAGLVLGLGAALVLARTRR